MRLTKEREKVIREQINAFKRCHSLPQCNDYADTYGPCMEELLTEIDALRAELKDMTEFLTTTDGGRKYNSILAEVDQLRADWETAAMKSNDWQTKWIGTEEENKQLRSELSELEIDFKHVYEEMVRRGHDVT